MCWDETFTHSLVPSCSSSLIWSLCYYQIEVNKTGKAKTVFVCPTGFWEFNYMPQGVRNAPSCLPATDGKVHGRHELERSCLFPRWLNSLLKTLEEHETRPTNILDHLKKYGLKLSEKCKFFLGFCGYYGKFKHSETSERLNIWLPISREAHNTSQNTSKGLDSRKVPVGQFHHPLWYFTKIAQRPRSWLWVVVNHRTVSGCRHTENSNSIVLPQEQPGGMF